MQSILIFLHKKEETAFLLDYAVQLAGKLKLNIDILFTLELSIHPKAGTEGTVVSQNEYTHEQTDNLMNEISDYLKSEVSRVKQLFSTAPQINHYTKQGMSHHVIDSFMTGKKYKYVMVASTPDNELFINDRNHDIIKQVGCPVWVIPSNTGFNGLRSIIYATDYKEEDVETLRKITGLAKATSAQITALHINKKPDLKERTKHKEFNSLLGEKIGYDQVEVKSLVQSENKSLVETLNDYAGMMGADLLVVLKENKGFFENLFGQSTTKKLISKAGLPVLVFQEDEE